MDRNLRSPLHAASLGGFLDPVQQLLLARSEVHGQDRDGHTALHVAAEAGHAQVGKGPGIGLKTEYRQNDRKVKGV